MPESAAAALGDAGWWLHGLKLAGTAAKPFVLRQFPALAQGIRAEEARQAPAFGEYDGFVPAAGKVARPVHARAASLTHAAANRRGVSLPLFPRAWTGSRSVDENDRDTDVWLDPMLRGRELHDLYAAMLVKCRDEKRKPNLGTDLPWLRDRTHTRLQILRNEMPPPSDDVFEREERDFLADVELFLEGRVRGRRRPDAGWVRGVVRPNAETTRQHGAARASGADCH